MRNVRMLLTVADGAMLSTNADGNEVQQPPLQHATSRRFSEKSPAEKEELYERIASQLITIGDSYAISTPPYGAESAGQSVYSVHREYQYTPCPRKKRTSVFCMYS